MYKQIIIKDSHGCIEQVIDVRLTDSSKAPIDTKYFNYHLMTKEYLADNARNSGTFEFDVCQGRLALLRAILDDLEWRNNKED